MIHSCFIFFAFLVIISVTSFPLDLVDLNVDSDSLNSAENSGVVKCTADASTNDLSDKVTDNDQIHLNIVRREINSCPVQGINPGFRGGETRPIPESSKTNPTKPRGSNKFCPDEKPEILSCGAPEVWLRGVLERVLNCVEGKASLSLPPPPPKKKLRILQ